jgi:hypothetical protein
VKSNPVFFCDHGRNLWASTDNPSSTVSPPSYVYGMVTEDDAEGLNSSQLENRPVVTILNPNTQEILTLNQQEFFKYMTMTNGAVLEWVLEWEK